MEDSLDERGCQVVKHFLRMAYVSARRKQGKFDATTFMKLYVEVYRDKPKKLSDRRRKWDDKRLDKANQLLHKMSPGGVAKKMGVSRFAMESVIKRHNLMR